LPHLLRHAYNGSCSVRSAARRTPRRPSFVSVATRL
jgi:hypothetical protein